MTSRKLIPTRVHRKRMTAVLESALVTLIWGSSFVFVKLGLSDIGPLMIAGLRYFLGFLILLPFLVQRAGWQRIASHGHWSILAGIGISAYAVGNGALFWGLKFLPATTVSFLMSLSPLLVMFAALVWLNEVPTSWQVVGVGIVVLGSVLFFWNGLEGGELPGVLIVAFGMLGFLAFGLLGRKVARDQLLDTLTLTTLPLGIGGGLLLMIAIPLEGFPDFQWQSAAIVLWLSLVNTALAYLIYNHALQELTAMEMNVILNLTPLGTALFAWWLLAERLEGIQIIGLLVMITGVVLVERLGKRRTDL